MNTTYADAPTSDSVGQLLAENHRHIVTAFERQCRRYAPEAFTRQDLYDDLLAETLIEYSRRLSNFETMPFNPSAWLHKYSDEALLRAKEIVWSGSDHVFDGSDTEPAIQRPDRLRETRWIIDLYCGAIAEQAPPGRTLERALQSVEIIVHLCYHAGGSGELSATRFPYDVLASRFSNAGLTVDRAFVDWTIEVLAESKPDWLNRNILGPLDNRRTCHVLGERSAAVSESISCRTTPTVDEQVESRWIDYELLLILNHAIEESRLGGDIDGILAKVVHAEPWLADQNGATLDRLASVLADLRAEADPQAPTLSGE